MNNKGEEGEIQEKGEFANKSFVQDFTCYMQLLLLDISIIENIIMI